jgi:hypothetical protein
MQIDSLGVVVSFNHEAKEQPTSGFWPVQTSIGVFCCPETGVRLRK